MKRKEKLFQRTSFISFVLLVVLAFILYKFGKMKDETNPVKSSQLEMITPKEKPTPVKERFNIVKMLDLVDSTAEYVVDANGNDLTVGALYLQSKSDLKLHLISDTLNIYQEADYALSIDNIEERNIKVRGNDGFFFIQGLILLPDAGKEVVLDSFDNYHVVMNY